MSQAVNMLPSSTIQGYCALLPLTKWPPSLVVYDHSKTRTLRRLTFVCSTPSSSSSSSSSNNRRRNPDFSRQSKGYSRGRARQNQDRERFDTPQENHPLPSKNGPVISFSSNPRYSATASPGQREKEIVQLFRKVQAQLRQRTAIKEEKKIESLQQGGQGGGEKGTVDSLLKLLKKHSVDRGKVASGSERDNSITEQPERRSISNDENSDSNSKFFETGSILNADEDVKKPAAETGVATSTRPPSKFQRRSPVPRVKFQPVYLAEKEEVVAEKEDELEKETDLDPVFFDELAEDSSESDMMDDELEDEMEDEMEEEIEVEEEEEEASVIENPVDLMSMKLVELKEVAKSRGVKGYSKLKKLDLVKLLEGL